MIELALTILVAWFLLVHLGALVVLSALAVAALVTVIAAVGFGWGVWHVLAPLNDVGFGGVLASVAMALAAAGVVGLLGERFQRGAVGKVEGRLYGAAFLALFVWTATLIPEAMTNALDGNLSTLAVQALVALVPWAAVTGLCRWRISMSGHRHERPAAQT
ncbi:hypothetical protein [uncultured Pseudacidovorax sp.]|uniref:hypothetical protein n=1 Tax=uncultured Pseudacidovorax sp. TaxID=679313 RepID=UPI0025D1F3E3|nr:hypothetical protein [uncultured Pseudacidovorax sp.]